MSTANRWRPIARCCALLLTAILALEVATSTAGAQSTGAERLGTLWERVLETPAPENPYTGGDPCIDLGGGVVAPFAPIGTPSVTCEVKPGTTIFVAAFSSECSTVEPPPYFGRNHGQLSACARKVDAGITEVEVKVDGQDLPVTEVVTRLLNLQLPKDNILTGNEEQAFSVAHGWTTQVGPLSAGTYQIVIHVEGTYVGQELDFTNTTTIVVRGLGS